MIEKLFYPNYPIPELMRYLIILNRKITKE